MTEPAGFTAKSTKGFAHESQNNKSIDWYTPEWIFKRIGLQFDLDPCAPVGGVPWIPANRSYSVADNGLNAEWVGTVWLNPPYGRQAEDWLRRMSIHQDGIALIFSRTDTAAFHDYLTTADSMLFLRGRIKFIDAMDATKRAGAPAGSVLAAWGSKCVSALAGMSDLGFLTIGDARRMAAHE